MVKLAEAIDLTLQKTEEGKEKAKQIVEQLTAKYII